VGIEAIFGTDGRPAVTAELDSDGKMAPFFASARSVGASSVNHFGFWILDWSFELRSRRVPSKSARRGARRGFRRRGGVLQFIDYAPAVGVRGGVSGVRAMAEIRAELRIRTRIQ
jgi:hypothetical protein